MAGLTAPCPSARPRVDEPSQLAISLKGVDLAYPGVKVVSNLNLSLEQCGLYAVVGPNGAGKSTLLKALAGQIKPCSGHITLNARAVGYLPQQSLLNTQFPLTVFELAAMGLWGRLGLLGGLSTAMHAQVLQALEHVGLADCAHLPMGVLSGGQLQRMLFARLWLQDPDIILLDEPFNAVDSKTCNDLVQQIKRWQQAKRTVLVVLHDIELVRAQFPLCILLAHQLIGVGASEVLLSPGNLKLARRCCEEFTARNYSVANEAQPL